MNKVRIRIVAVFIAMSGVAFAPSAHADVPAGGPYLTGILCFGQNAISFYNATDSNPVTVGTTASQVSHISGTTFTTGIVDSLGNVGYCGIPNTFASSGLVTQSLLDAVSANSGYSNATAEWAQIQVGVTHYVLYNGGSTYFAHMIGLNKVSFTGDTNTGAPLIVRPIGAWTTSFNGNGATSGTAPSPIFTAQGGTGGFNLPGNIGRSTNSTSNAVLTKTGYTFLGWNTSPTATAPMTLTNYAFTPTGDTVLYAVWKANS